jgi:hypothetical protein
VKPQNPHHCSSSSETNPTSSSSSSSSLLQIFSIEQRPTHPLTATPNRFQLAEIKIKTKTTSPNTTTAAAASKSSLNPKKVPNRKTTQHESHQNAINFHI